MTKSDTNSSKFEPPPNTEDAIAVAIQQPIDRDHIPRVIAGGKGRVAEQILGIAFQKGIKVREDANLAELLSAIELESEIPVGAFAAVAEILAYVYAINNAIKTKTDEDAKTNLNSPENSVDPIHQMANELLHKWANSKNEPL